MGGILGSLLTGVFAAPSLGGTGIYDYVTNKVNPDYSISGQVWIQLQGVLTTLVEFAASEDGRPSAELIRGTDGNLYGTTGGPDGSIYRLLFPGAPLVAIANVAPPESTNAIVEAQVNARGAATTVLLEYGADGINFPTTVMEW